jgi:hypothetical protein
MKKSITNNDNIAFCFHLTAMMDCGLPNIEKGMAAKLAADAWRMLCVAVKFHWRAGEKESARRAIVRFLDEVDQGWYNSGCMGYFLNDTYRAFTGKAVKEG